MVDLPAAKANLVNADGLARAYDGGEIVLEEPVYFVFGELEKRWPELPDEDSWFDLSTVAAGRVRAESGWLISTYLRLKQRGYNVKITDHLIPDHINVCYLSEVLAQPDAHRAYVVEVCGDRACYHWGDYAIEQSPVLVEGYRNRCLIDYWPQPGLIPRDEARGDELRSVGYVGFPPNLARAFRSETFTNELRSIGVEFILREDPAQWRDFSDLDLLLAVRDLPWRWTRTKPATKMVNAWLCGVVPILGPEPAYRYWGTPGGDYLEVNDPAEAIAAIARLKDDPAEFGRMRRQGAELAGLHCEEAVVRQWAAVLAGPVCSAFLRWRTASGPVWFGRRLGRRFSRVYGTMSRKAFYFLVRDLPKLRQKLPGRR